MLQLAYISTSRLMITEGFLDAILEVSRRNNLTSGLTGLLLSGGQRFLQVLEGPQADVLATYSRIQDDHRHFGVVRLSSKRITSRAFGEWAMAHRTGGVSDRSDNLVKVVAQMVGPLEDKNLRAYLLGFADLHARA